jgi:G3E family GTPase
MIRFILVGGFLGAGKTTTIARLADGYRRQGRNVAIITNDQGADLVDTLRLRALGHHVGEFTGACFCGHVDELLQTVDQLGVAARPDVVLLEPIGSCLDLAATVIRPLARQFADRMHVSPYVVLLKPRHGLRILEGRANAGVSPAAVYLFRKQLEEADVLAVNRIDELSGEEVDRLESLVVEQYPGRRLLRVSARTGQGFDELNRALDPNEPPAARWLEVDYDQYAAGEAALGWLNGSLLVSGAAAFPLQDFVLDAVRRTHLSLSVAGGQIAHVKAIASHAGCVAAANLVGNDFQAELSIASPARVRQAELTINARVGLEPRALEECVRTALAQACAAHALESRIVLLQCFRPGGPLPAHRVV